MTSSSGKSTTYSRNAVYRKVVGGMLGGFVEASCLHPLDTVKTRLQLSRVRTNSLPSGSQYRGIRDCATQIVRKEGLSALYKGYTPFATHLVCKYGVRFTVNFKLRSLVCGEDAEKTTFLQNIFAGMLAGTSEALLIVTPFEVVKTRLQGQHGRITGSEAKKLKYKGPIHAVGRIIRNEGILGMWKGATPTIVRNSSNQAFMFSAYTFARENLWNNPKDLKTWQAGVTGLISACIGPILNCPADVIKTRMMNQTISTVPADERYKNMVDAFRRILRTEGPRSLYAGLGPRLARVAPGQGITWMVVENLNTVCNRMDWLT